MFIHISRVAFEFECLKYFIGYSLHTFGKRVTTIPSTMVHVSPPSLTAAALASFEMSYISFVNSLAIPNVLPNPIGDILAATSRPILKKRNIDEEWKRSNINNLINEFVEIKINYSIIKIRYECKNMNQCSNYFRFFQNHQIISTSNWHTIMSINLKQCFLLWINDLVWGRGWWQMKLNISVSSIVFCSLVWSFLSFARRCA